MKIKNKNWIDVSREIISMPSVRKLYSQPEYFRFTEDTYPAGSIFTGIMSVCTTIYVLEGVFIHIIDGEELLLHAGEFAEFPPCNYTAEVGANSHVRFIRVSHLPEKLRKKKSE